MCVCVRVCVCVCVCVCERVKGWKGERVYVVVSVSVYGGSLEPKENPGVQASLNLTRVFGCLLLLCRFAREPVSESIVRHDVCVLQQHSADSASSNGAAPITVIKYVATCASTPPAFRIMCEARDRGAMHILMCRVAVLKPAFAYCCFFLFHPIG